MPQPKLMLSDGPLIVQGDKSILLEASHPRYAEARDQLSGFAELVKSPEHFHTYQLTPLSLWNAASAGWSPERVLQTLKDLSKYPLPPIVTSEVQSVMSRYGKIKLKREGQDLILEADDPLLMKEIRHHKKVQPYLLQNLDDVRSAVRAMSRGFLKMELAHLGYPAEDLAGYMVGPPLDIQFRDTTLDKKPLKLRPYQDEAASTFYGGGGVSGGSGVIVLPCGSGKTIVGMKAMTLCRTHTLILTTNVVAAKQWIGELLDKTTLKPEEVGEYNGSTKTIRPVTVATYQIITYRRRKEDHFPHFEIFEKNPWGLILYDEVHLLPAPLFRLSAEMQATRRLGLTATLVREDHKETDVFSLIGPKKYDVPWKILEAQGWIAQAICHEIRVELNPPERLKYAVSSPRDKVTLAAKNPMKTLVVKTLLEKHSGDSVLIIGQYLEQLNQLAASLRVPLLTGQTKNEDRLKTFNDFRKGKLNVLMVSKIGNFAIDLPDANVLIQISGTFGSRQEEAQRLGRLLRPKSHKRPAQFYSLVTKDTREQEFAMNRQLFLTEQGYQYTLEDWGDAEAG